MYRINKWKRTLLRIWRRHFLWNVSIVYWVIFTFKANMHQILLKKLDNPPLNLFNRLKRRSGRSSEQSTDKILESDALNLAGNPLKAIHILKDLQQAEHLITLELNSVSVKIKTIIVSFPSIPTWKSYVFYMI